MTYTLKNNSQWDRFLKWTKSTPHYIHWCLIFIFVLALYTVTLAQDLTWQDQGEYQVHVAHCILNRPGDVVRVHPLFIITAHYLGNLGLFNYAYSANLVSAIFTAVTVANIYLLLFRLVGRIWPAILAALTFALAHSVWFLGVQAQTYGMANAAMTTGLLFVIAYHKSAKTEYLFWMGFAFGLGICAHLMSQIAFVVIMVWLFIRCVRKSLSIWAFPAILLFWTAGACLLWMAMALEYHRSGDLIGTIQSALWGKWGPAVFNLGELPRLCVRSAKFFILNFPTPLVLLALPGIIFSFTRFNNVVVARLLLSLTIIYGLFALRYDIPNQNNFFLPMYLFVSIYIGLGFAYTFRRQEIFWSMVTAVLLLSIPPAYIVISNYVRQHSLDLGTKRHIPYRDEYAYYILPWQHQQSGPRLFANAALKSLPPGAVIFADKTTLPPLQYLHEVEMVRPDVDISLLPDKATIQNMQLAQRRVFTVSNVKGYYPHWVKEPANLTRFPISKTEHIFEIAPEEFENE
jgi:hypothetical protein